LAKQRQAQVNRFEKLARKCQGWDERMMKQHVKSPDTVRVLNKNININVALVAVFIETIDYPDKELPLQLLEGLPICGDIDYDSGFINANLQRKTLEYSRTASKTGRHPTAFGLPSVRHN